jgi:hypothetical protein
MLDDNDFFNYDNSYIFSPNVTVFDKSIFVQYKKVGTRYISGIASYPLSESEDCYQLELFIQTRPMENIKLSMDSENYKINGLLYDLYTYTSFEVMHEHTVEMQKFKKFTSAKEFLDYTNVSNFSQFFFENPRDLYFVIRNPIERFLSGVIQLLITGINHTIIDEKSRNDLKYYTKLTDRELKDAMKVFYRTNSDVSVLDEIPKNILFPIMEYFLEKKMDITFSDSHTENYLQYFKDWMYGIKDKSKIKIIDISQFSSNTSKNLIINLKTDLIKNDIFDLIEPFKSSNKKIYKDFLSEYVSKHLTFYNYLKSEIQIYQGLIGSKFFMDLKD